jgi:hypothetical protein
MRTDQYKQIRCGAATRGAAQRRTPDLDRIAPVYLWGRRWLAVGRVAGFEVVADVRRERRRRET